MSCRKWTVTVIPLALLAGVWLATDTLAAAVPGTTAVVQAPPAAVEQEPAQPEPPPQPEAYVYDPAGRRDPFVSLLNRGDLIPLSERPPDLAGLTVNEVALRGIVLSEGTYIAVLQAPDNKTYIVRDGDRLWDGAVRSITGEAVIFVEEVNDPLSLVKEREVRKSLRGPEERIR